MTWTATIVDSVPFGLNMLTTADVSDGVTTFREQFIHSPENPVESFRAEVVTRIPTRDRQAQPSIIRAGTVVECSPDEPWPPPASELPTDEATARAAFLADIRLLHRKVYLVTLNVLATDDPVLLDLRDRCAATLQQYPQFETAVRPV